MKLQLVREPSCDGATLGRLTLDGAWCAYTLEDVVREVPGVPVAEWKLAGQTAIPRGTYTVIVDFSNRFQREMPRLLDVPGFDGVRIHSGNTAADTEGCILVGVTQDRARIGRSRFAFDTLMTQLEAAYQRHEPITIEVT